MVILVKGPSWANGCATCAHGIVSTASVGKLPLHLERAILAQNGHVVFCACRAGLMARQYARKVWRQIETGEEYLHPEIISHLLKEAAQMPTVHGPEPVYA